MSLPFVLTNHHKNRKSTFAPYRRRSALFVLVAPPQSCKQYNWGSMSRFSAVTTVPRRTSNASDRSLSASVRSHESSSSRQVPAAASTFQSSSPIERSSSGSSFIPRPGGRNLQFEYTEESEGVKVVTEGVNDPYCRENTYLGSLCSVQLSSKDSIEFLDKEPAESNLDFFTYSELSHSIDESHDDAGKSPVENSRFLNAPTRRHAKKHATYADTSKQLSSPLPTVANGLRSRTRRTICGILQHVGVSTPGAMKYVY